MIYGNTAHELQETSGRERGFTLIELLIVVVIIGILAAIAIPQFSSTREKAYDAAAKSDLRNLMTAQEGYFYEFGTYATSTSVLETEEGLSSTSGVNVSVVQDGSTGYKADASHADSPTCFWVHMGPGGEEKILTEPDASSGSGECSG